MRWWSQCLSMVIAKTASRNIAYKTDKLADSVLAAQSAVLTRESCLEEEVLEDLGSNSDLYACNQVFM